MNSFANARTILDERAHIGAANVATKSRHDNIITEHIPSTALVNVHRLCCSHAVGTRPSQHRLASRIGRALMLQHAMIDPIRTGNCLNDHHHLWTPMAETNAVVWPQITPFTKPFDCAHQLNNQRATKSCIRPFHEHQWVFCRNAINNKFRQEIWKIDITTVSVQTRTGTSNCATPQPNAPTRRHLPPPHEMVLANFQCKPALVWRECARWIGANMP